MKQKGSNSFKRCTGHVLRYDGASSFIRGSVYRPFLAAVLLVAFSEHIERKKEKKERSLLVVPSVFLRDRFIVTSKSFHSTAAHQSQS